MTASVGVKSFSSVSRSMEEKGNNFIKKYFDDSIYPQIFELQKSIFVDDKTFGFSYVTEVKKQPKEIKADGGWVISKKLGIPIAILEDKHQDKTPNVIERFHRYNHFFELMKVHHGIHIPYSNYFLVSSGSPTFIQNTYPHWTCFTLERLGGVVFRYEKEFNIDDFKSTLSVFFSNLMEWEKKTIKSKEKTL